MSDVRRAAAAASRTSSGLTVALLGYFVLVTQVITLSPFDFAPSPGPIRITFGFVASDVVANVALFVPIGFLLRSLEIGRHRVGWRSVLTAAVFSVTIEITQIFLRDRFVSPIDVAANTSGAILGVLIRSQVERLALWRPEVVGRVGLDIPLVGLLYLMVPQLWLSGAGLVDDPRRATTTMLLACAGTIVLVALHRHRWQGGVRLAAGAVPPIALLWFMVGALPALAESPGLFGIIALAVVAVTWWLLRGALHIEERRFESDTLRNFIPVFLLYLVVAALWPPFRAIVSWHGAFGFVNRLNDAGIVELLELLEQVGGFTLLGYAAAEWRGRRELPLGIDLPQVAAIALAVAGALEVAQGFLAGTGASLLRALLAVIGAAYGTVVYHLARAHVRALRAQVPREHQPPAEHEGVMPPGWSPRPAD